MAFTVVTGLGLYTACCIAYQAVLGFVNMADFFQSPRASSFSCRIATKASNLARAPSRAPRSESLSLS
jgi:hypothetical protein